MPELQHKIYEVTGFRPAGAYTLEVFFNDGSSQSVDFEGVLEGELYGPLRERGLFDRVRFDPERRNLVWPNGADFDPEILHDWPKRKAAMLEAATRWKRSGNQVFGRWPVGGLRNCHLDQGEPLPSLQKGKNEERDTVSTSNAEDFINDTQKAIKEVRRRAFWFNPAGWAICLVGLAISIAGLIKGFALAPRGGLFAGIFSALGTSPWTWLYENAWPLWWLVQAFVPYPDITQTFPSWSALGSWGGWIAWSYGLISLGIVFRKTSASLYKQACEAQKDLNLQATLLRVMQSRQSEAEGDIVGDGNFVNVVNTINNIWEKGESQGWWTQPLGLIVIGVLINVISKVLHLS